MTCNQSRITKDNSFRTWKCPHREQWANRGYWVKKIQGSQWRGERNPRREECRYISHQFTILLKESNMLHRGRSTLLHIDTSTLLHRDRITLIHRDRRTLSLERSRQFINKQRLSILTTAQIFRLSPITLRKRTFPTTMSLRPFKPAKWHPDKKDPLTQWQFSRDLNSSAESTKFPWSAKESITYPYRENTIRLIWERTSSRDSIRLLKTIPHCIDHRRTLEKLD